MPFEIYPSITTTFDNWIKQLKEIEKLRLKAVCVFPTCLGKKERYEIYQSLIKNKVTHLPLVHLRHDTDAKELDFLCNNFRTQWFNIHSQQNSRFVLEYDLSKFQNQILIENTVFPLTQEAGKFIGLCADFSHIESQRLKKSALYENWIECLKTFPIKASHISAIKNTIFEIPGYGLVYDIHRFSSLEEFDYLKRYQKYLPEVCALELENSIEEQLEVKEYLTKILFSKQGA